jgi:hypothetical protein
MLRCTISLTPFEHRANLPIMGRQSNYRTDDQLLASLDEIGDWSISGLTARSSHGAQSLRLAINQVADIAKTGAMVVALRCAPFDSIIVFPAQIRRLQRIIAERDEGRSSKP